MTKDYLMALTMPCEIFTVRGIKSQYRELVKKWHPDINNSPDAVHVMSKINSLYSEGIDLIDKWKFYEKDRLIYRRNSHSTSSDYSHTHYTYEKEPDRVQQKHLKTLLRSDGKTLNFKYICTRTSEVGTIYISDTKVFIETTRRFKDKYIRMHSKLSALGLTKSKLIDSFDTQQKSYVVLQKIKQQVNASHLLDSTNLNKALLVRRLGLGYSLLSSELFKHGLLLGDFSLENIYIDVDSGEIDLLGLIFYVTDMSKPTFVSEQMLKYVSDLKVSLCPEKLPLLINSHMITYNIRFGLKVDDYYKWLLTPQQSLEDNLLKHTDFCRNILSVTTHGFDIDKFHISSYSSFRTA